MSEEFAKVFIRNLLKRSKDAELRHDFSVAQALKEQAKAVKETMIELGHKL